MKYTKELVDKYAEDLLIQLSDEENKMVLEEFEIIEENMEKINRFADIEKVEAMTHAIDIICDFREDEVKEELTTEEVLQNVAHKTIDSVVVPKVVES